MLNRKITIPQRNKIIKYKFRGKIWKYKGVGGWHFVNLTKSLTEKIRKTHIHSEEGWGRLKIVAKINNSEWAGAIWFDSKKKIYLLPVKLEIRKKEHLRIGDSFIVTLKISNTPKAWVPFLGSRDRL